MDTLTSNAGITTFRRNYKKLVRLVPTLWSLEIGSSLKSHALGYMDLHLDVLQKQNTRMVIVLSHYYQYPNGDMIADPDMEISVHHADKFIEALTYQDSLCYQKVYLDKDRFYPKLKKDLNEFLGLWLANCLDQGYLLSSNNTTN